MCIADILSRAEFNFSVNREFGKFSLRHDLSVKVSFTDKLLTVLSSVIGLLYPRLFVNQELVWHCGKWIMKGRETERELSKLNAVMVKIIIWTFLIKITFQFPYRVVGQVVVDLGWVDFDLTPSCTTNSAKLPSAQVCGMTRDGIFGVKCCWNFIYIQFRSALTRNDERKKP